MQKYPCNSNLLEQNLAVGSYLDQLLHQATEYPAELKEEDNFIPLVQEDGLTVSEPMRAKEKIIEPIVFPAPEPITLEAELFPLQCLMFRVAGNRLSMPLIRMKSVLLWSDNLTCLPQSPDWLFGLLKYRDHNIRVVDSTRVLNINPVPDSAPGHILLLGDDEWAITCDKLENVITLEFSDVQWRQGTDNSKIFGTICHSLASLLNPGGIVNSLNTFKLN